MSLIKKIIFGLFVIAAVALGTWAYFDLKNNKKPTVDALSVLPDNCLIYINTSNFSELNKKINSQSLIADKLKLFGDINLFCNTLRVFDSVFTCNKDLEEAIKKNIIHFALYEKNLNWLATFNIKRLGNQQLIIEELEKLLHAQKKENDIYEFSLSNKERLYFSLSSGIAIISNAAATIEESLNKTNPKLLKNKSFLDFKNTLEENNLLLVYINHELYSKSKVASKLNLSIFCKDGFSSGNLGIEPSQLTFNGFLRPGASELISGFSDQDPQEPEFLNLLPTNTSSFKAYGFSSFEELYKKTPQQNNLFWNNVNDSALFNVENDFCKNTQQYLAGFETKIPDCKFVLLKVADTLKAAEQLAFMSDSLVSQDSINCYKLKLRGLKTPLKLFSAFTDVTTNFAAIYNSHLFFCANRDDLFKLIAGLKKETSLSLNESFAVYKNQNLSEPFNFLLYLSPSKNKETIKNFFNYESTEKNAFENFKHFSYCVTNNKSNFKFRCELLHEAETINKEQNVLWSLNLEAPAALPAYNFINHITRENELALQDEQKLLYLVNAKGTILWKKKLNEQINSKIFTVDIFKNNKYQLLFSTENYLHLIDRNGNYVQGYPVKLPAAATSELSVLDYDNDKDYRLFIACKNKMIYNYSIFGTKVDKFVPVKTDAEVKLPVQYAKVGLSDYLITADTEGKIYTFSRKGEGRIGLRNKTTENLSAFYVDATNNINSTYFVYVDDKNNLINKISFSDKKIIEQLSVQVGPSIAKFANTDDNKAMDVLLTKGNEILAYDLNANLLFEKAIDNDLSESDYFSDESHSLFLSFSKNKQEVTITDKLKQKTKLIKATAMPYICNLFNDNKKYLIVTNGAQLNCVPL